MANAWSDDPERSSRRRWLEASGAGALGDRLLAAATAAVKADRPASERLRGAVFGGHPDDPESGAGG
ncbi:MAG TPA: hypothetical protein EYH34_16230 [Planctomycetes bacterium]|nr:hypothetical protein [Planctomycetota bacterium]